MKTNSFIISWCLKQRSHNIKIIKCPRIYSVFINRRIFAATGCLGSKWFKWDSCALYALQKSRVCTALKIERTLSNKNWRNTHSKVKVVLTLYHVVRFSASGRNHYSHCDTTHCKVRIQWKAILSYCVFKKISPLRWKTFGLWVNSWFTWILKQHWMWKTVQII